MARKYRMKARTEKLEETRHRIIEAGMDVHAMQGIAATSYQEIAERAGTSQGTVYRHFPSLNDLLSACAGLIPVLRPVDEQYAGELYRGMGDPFMRLEILIRGTCDCYEHDQAWLRAANGEEGLLPALREIVRTERENLELLTRHALAGTEAGERSIRVVAALLDFPVWQSLRRAGLSEEEASREILELAIHELKKDGIR